MKKRAIVIFIFIDADIAFNTCLPAFAAENEDTYDDVSLLDKQTAAANCFF